ncbi:MAG: formate dehydrogenase accessory sulfurtransferase FdhD [Candidatus Latescibacteria bacterium]|nr:formate dehydrogenase accessory sulfurtransferase FdhD [Candidatus Latescibacterota bacterium]NIM66328.1 formate dehydrogenase accessory sulfurtransferase FdhD [Candidatus Latescibacterota bacterium]NIO02807.1 formate dehydrogenase accessory sulfurtransferase FdhD [Candidatus Latescibacterota bacterium]NIO29942.1 formate dehydrogenase accessory sulfurtransferase FdhD [Candidatus Latescibacterota bacterium]NIO57557.1 formate dehydrogenase accessory sulfurtransferase FdhD [Candidatus Latesciba
MGSDTPLGTSVEYEVIKYKSGSAEPAKVQVATEVPFTIMVNETEVVTLMCTPENLEELCYGFLFTSGIIESRDDVVSYLCDESRWMAQVTIEEMPDLSMLSKRLYTSGCGKGVMYSSLVEITSRHPLKTAFKVDKDALIELMRWLQKSSDLFKKSGGVHSAALSENGKTPKIAIDDVGRHNAVDKAIGDGLIRGVDFSQCVLVCSGRTSADMLHKARRSGIPVTISRGAPTHQTILLAREMGVTVVGFARGGGFTIYTHPGRIVF